MSIKDVIKNGVYENLIGGAGVSVANIFIILFASCIIGVYIYTVYRSTSKAAFYSRDLNITLAGMTVVVAAIIIAMQSNLIVSLGMVGALSIVRFRNAVKNPIDLLYLFWAISEGIICGVGLYLLAVALCIVMTVLLLVLEKIPNAKAASLLVIRASSDIDSEAVKALIKTYSKYCKEKSFSIKNGEAELIVELKTTQQKQLIGKLNQVKGIFSINFLSHDGEYRI